MTPPRLPLFSANRGGQAVARAAAVRFEPRGKRIAEPDRSDSFTEAEVRRAVRPAFDRHLASLVHLVMSEVESLHADGLNLQVSAGIATLTPRQRIVLACLIDGQNIKEAASHLGLSPHTVTDHVKAIYKASNVSSRAELLNRFISGGKR